MIIIAKFDVVNDIAANVLRINEVFPKENLGKALQKPNRLSAVMCPKPIGENAMWQGS